MKIYAIRVLMKLREHYQDYGLYRRRKNALENLKKFQESKYVEDAYIAIYETND